MQVSFLIENQHVSKPPTKFSLRTHLQSFPRLSDSQQNKTSTVGDSGK